MAARGVDYAPHEIDKALTTLAYYGGNSARAGKALGISDATLREWRTQKHRERYLEICEREAPKLEALAANQAREIIVRSAEVEHSILDRLAAQDDQEPTTKELSELAGALQRLSTSKGINTTKLLELTGRPTQIVEHRDPKQAAAALARRLGVTLDGTAVDITDHPALPNPAAPLPSQSHDANARDRSVSPAVD